MKKGRGLPVVEVKGKPFEMGKVTVDSIASIFRDHVNRPGSACRHRDPNAHRLEVSETILSVVFDLTRLRAHVLKGKPCAGECSVFQLGESR